MENFEYKSASCRTIFGNGTINKLPDILEQQDLSCPLLLSTAQQVDQLNQLKNILGGKIAGTYSKAVMHTPRETTIEAVAIAKDLKADCVVSIGGGSTIGLGKTISFRTGLPHICIPTTYAGSDQTPILGETEDGLKVTISDPKILPGIVIYDADLILSLPSEMSATSGLNAIAHARAPLEGIKSLVSSLPDIVADPSSRSARSLSFYGSWLCGICLGNVGMALHHKLCHTLGGSFNLPHAETHAIVLPHALAYTAPMIPEIMKKLGSVFPEGAAIDGLNALQRRLRVKKALKDYGLREEDIDTAVTITLSKPYWNPRKVQKDALKEVIRRCWAGEDAREDL
ncbi:Dehydroquinate synthase-like protein [Myriangium duriaei CBS 260.36]|uniref:Dehydroquinate synthase-like protein n=1 Tax=Myriangium duriaei CBS 260.36 TaxID=1168546 RepID=A0A9P4MG13_9PEZI|nr:Dehydroquinate synthase-like protein [Myriangium duriaei CBS 260.36]